WPVAASQSFTALSELAEASHFSSGLNATLVIPFLCPFRVRSSRPVSTSHKIMIASPADARRVSSGLKAAEDVQKGNRGRRVRRTWSPPVCHNFTVPSKLADANRLPSGLKATLQTDLLCPL